jgi:hypothetical protein
MMAVFGALSALLLAIAIAAAEDRPAKERVAVGLRVLGGCAFYLVAGSWVMHWIHG